jgi:hypothetical protein
VQDDWSYFIPRVYLQGDEVLGNIGIMSLWYGFKVNIGGNNILIWTC